MAIIQFQIALTCVLIATVLACKDGDHSAQPSSFSSTRAFPTNSNFYTLSSVHRRHKIGPTIKSPARRLKDPAFSMNAIPISSEPGEKIVIPIGVSHYQPVQYVNSFKPFEYSSFKPSRSSVPAKGNSSVATDQKVSESKTNTQKVNAQQPRLIELESSYIPLNIRFTSRASRLNIVPNDNNNDLIGQDSNQHDSFGKDSNRHDTFDKDTNNIREKPRSVNLDSRVIFGQEKREEPLVLKQGQKNQIPNNMQRIIKCIFPDFKFDGDDQVKSAC